MFKDVAHALAASEDLIELPGKSHYLEVRILRAEFEFRQ